MRYTSSNKNLNEMPEELRKAEVEKEMQKIRERMEKRLREANTEELLKKQEAEQKVKIEALRQKLQRERQAQIIKEMAERNAVEHKATVKAAQIAARKEQEARETGRTSDFDLEEKRKKMMEAYYTQQDKVKARKLMGTEVDLELAEDDLKETKAAQDRMKKVEETMEELRAEQAKKLEKEKEEKTSAIKNIFNKLTSWPRRKIPTQEELNADGLKEGTVTASTAESKETATNKASETLKESENASSIKEEAVPTQESDRKLSYQEKNLQELRDIVMNHETTQEEIDEIHRTNKEKYRAKAEKKKTKIRKPNIMDRIREKAIQRYTSNLSNGEEKQKTYSRENIKRTRNDMMRELYSSVDHDKAFQDSLKKAQDNKAKEATPSYRPGWGR